LKKHEIIASRLTDRSGIMACKMREIGEDLARRDRRADSSPASTNSSTDTAEDATRQDPRPHYRCEFTTTTPIQPKKIAGASIRYKSDPRPTDEEVSEYKVAVKQARKKHILPPAYMETVFQPCLAETKTVFTIIANDDRAGETSGDLRSECSIYLDPGQTNDFHGQPQDDFTLAEIVLHKDSKLRDLISEIDVLAGRDARIRGSEDNAMSARAAGQDSTTVEEVRRKAEDWVRFRSDLSKYLESGEALPYCPEFKSSTPQDSNSNSDSASSTGAERDQQPVFGQMRPFRVEESASMRTVLEDASVIYRPVRLNAQFSDLHTMLPGGEALLRAHTDEASWGQPDSLMSSCVVS
jgi:hypothetical protein